MIIEDSNAGFDFLSEMTNVSCISANGKSNIPKLLRKTTDQEEMVVVVADGAAIGCEMEKIERIREGGKKVILYVPESFEWLILSSGLIDGNRIAQVLEAPEEHIDSEQFFSWERFFTSLLVQETQDTYLHYSKSRLNPAYLQEKQSRPILDRMRPLMELLSGEDTSGGRFASGDGSSV